MSDIPCKDCITFAVCNAQISNNSPYSDVLYYLLPKCSLLKEYTKSNKYEFSTQLILKAVRYFRFTEHTND